MFLGFVELFFKSTRNLKSFITSVSVALSLRSSSFESEEIDIREFLLG